MYLSRVTRNTDPIKDISLFPATPIVTSLWHRRVASNLSKDRTINPGGSFGQRHNASRKTNKQRKGNKIRV